MSKKWRWMMDYCLKWRIPPAQKWAWDAAEKSFNKKDMTKPPAHTKN